MSRKVAIGIACAVAAALVAQFGFFFFRDNFSTHYPLKVLSAEAFRAGEIPWWNFHAGGGQPLAGNPNALTFYPDNVLYLFLPAHVAFNLHFLLHFAAAFAAMRALCRTRGLSVRTATFAATTYALSGVVISSFASYHSIVVVALVPFAFYAVERRSARLLGVACGLLGLAPEPVITIGVAIALAILAFRRMGLAPIAGAVAMAAAIASPQLIALSEIVGEVERVAGFSIRTMLNTSLTWTRVAEIFLWPFLGFLNDPGGGELRNRFFSTIFIGLIAAPALFRRSRYVAIVAAMLFLALGSTNPILLAAVEHLGRLRVFRFPEKFVLILVPALVVLIAELFERTRFRRVWAIVTLVPLVWIAIRALPIDWFAPYRVAPVASRRVHIESAAMPSLPAREEYRLRAKQMHPIFGATAGLRYVINRSPDRMHSLLSRIVIDRYRAAPQRYLAVAAGPDARIVPRAAGASSIDEAIARFERGEDVAPRAFVSAPARVVAYREIGQRIEIDLEARGPALLLVNQSYFSAWVARLGDRELETLPVDIDRLGVVVPESGRVTLTFGRRRALVVTTWVLSLLLLVAAPLVEKRDRRAREVERPADEH